MARTEPLGTNLPDGVRFVGPEPGWDTGWSMGDAPTTADLNACVACGLCLPHCPTYRLTGEESASPRGRIAAMRAVHEGRATTDDTFARFMDLCLVCRACEDVCPSHVPFGRMMEAARTQIEPTRSAGERFLRWLGLEVILPSRSLTWIAAALAPLARPLLPRRIADLVPHGRSAPFRRLPEVTPSLGVERGTVALLSGCVQDVWFRRVNEATVRVLSRNGWRVVIPRAQTCCGALAAHNGRLGTARRLARRNARAFAGVDHVVVNAAGCGAHMASYGELVEDADLPVRDVMAFLHEEGLVDLGSLPEPAVVAYHDACHALRAQRIRHQPRALLGAVGNLDVVEVPAGDRCCGAAGIYNVTEPEMSGALRRQKAESIAATGARIVASANPGCTMQIAAGVAELGLDIRIVHPIELLDRAMSV